MARIQNTQMARAAQGQNMAAAQPQVKQSMTVMMNSLLDSEGYRKRFDELLERIREIRASERKFYQKITDLYAILIANCTIVQLFGNSE